MFDSFIPKINNTNLIANSKIDAISSPQPFRLNAIKVNEGKPAFTEVMGGMLKGLDNVAKKPDKMVQEAMVNPEIDLHDVAIVMNEAELTLNIATQSTTKLIQGYEKIISMQV